MQPVFTLGETFETHQFSEYTSQVWKNPPFNTTASYSLLDRAVERSIIPTAIRWVRQQPQAQMIPILGARSVKQLQDNLGVLAWKLTDEQWKCLDKVSAIDLGFPHRFLNGNRYIYGATYDKIENHRV